MKFKIDKYEAFFFDFDGVIVDSINIKTDAFAELYKPFGEEVISKVVSHHVSHGGMSRFEKFRYYHENFINKKISESEMMELAQKFSDLVVGKVLSQLYHFRFRYFLIYEILVIVTKFFKSAHSAMRNMV